MSAITGNSFDHIVKKHWGFDVLRPLQAEAIEATLAGRDALVVMPTGGGKSLCYQVPPLVTGKLTLVVSPLIALMADQVAGLKLAGVPAACLNSHTKMDEAREVRAAAKSGELRLLLVAPERLMSSGFLGWLTGLESSLGAIAIDESHCISQWGHDFRPEYRRLAELREVFPNLSVQAYTATATPRVRADIMAQLCLRNPAELVGRFDRPNLAYRVVPRASGWKLGEQAAEVIKRHEGQGAIVYCISRKDTEGLAAELVARGIDARAYHAGMPASTRARVQDDFRNERLNAVVATVAFGMGIDRSDVRCVIHAAMPQTVEHYQQETGRAGRDGLPAECVMFFGGGDGERWRRILTRPNEDGSGRDAAALAAQLELMEQMRRLAGGARCRHRALSEYFGQAYEGENCKACDICLRERSAVDGATELAQKILSCVARVKERFGAGHIADVLLGSTTERALQFRHDTLSTFGLLTGMRRVAVTSYINQLLDAGLLERDGGEYPVLKLNPASWEVMRSRRTVSLLEAGPGRARQGGEASALSPEESGLFEALRRMRRALAESLNVPPFVVFSDATLQEVAQIRPSSTQSLSTVRGVGQKKIEQFGEAVLACVREHALATGLALDAALPALRPEPRDKRGGFPPAAGRLFAEGKTIEDVASALGRAKSTVSGYLESWVIETKPATIEAWVNVATQRRVTEARRELGPGPFKPLFEHLNGEVTYDAIRIVLAHTRTT